MPPKKKKCAVFLNVIVFQLCGKLAEGKEMILHQGTGFLS
jgi:hypothetical protein